MSQDMFTKQLLTKVMRGHDIAQADTTKLMNAVLTGVVPSEQLAALLCCLAMKGETEDEILGMLVAMREHMQKLTISDEAIDVCGTGGDQSGTFNISTTVAFVVAGAGVKVAKHGNRAASSKSGSADVLEALGIKLDLTPQQAQKVLQKTGFVFLFAPTYHPAMKQVALVRRALGVPTIFNKLGPFCNPAGVQWQLVGVPDIADAEKLAGVVSKLPHTRVLVVSSHDGLDEVSIAASTTIFQVENNQVRKYVIKPSDYGITRSSVSNLQGGDAQQNARILRDILSGATGPKRDIVLLNAACALYAAGAAESIQAAMALAASSIDSGHAIKMLQNTITETRQYA